MCNCLSNKCNCYNMCCRLIGVNIISIDNLRDQDKEFNYFVMPLKVYNARKRYYEFHGVEKVMINENMAVLRMKGKIVEINNQKYIYSPCHALDQENGKCKVHKRNKPKICEKSYNNGVYDFVLWFEECIYYCNKPDNAESCSVNKILNLGGE